MHRVILLALTVALASLILGVTLAYAAKGGEFFIGAAGTPPTGTEADGAVFNDPQDVATNHETGQIYVADSNNHRIQRLDADGNFEVAWGRNVSESASTGDDGEAGGFAFEVCVEAADCQGGTSGAVVGGYSGARGGMFDNPHGVALDPDTGDLYVTDRDNGRVQHFSFEDNGTPADPSDDLPVFEGAWGSNTIPDGGTGNLDGPNELQRVDLKFKGLFEVDPPSGSFTMTFDGQTTAPIAWPPSEESLTAALEGLSNIAPGDVGVSEPVTVPEGGPNEFTVWWTIEFEGAYANTNMPRLGLDVSGIEFDGEIDDAFLGGGFNSGALIEGDSNYEVCTVAAECQAALHGVTAGTFGHGNDNCPCAPHFSGSRGIAVSSDGAPGAGKVFATDSGNRRVMEFSIDGSFERAFGLGVDSGGSEFEICTAASGCQGGTSGGGSPNGSFGSNDPNYIASDATGTVYVAANGRVTRFDSSVEGDDEAAAEAMLLPDPYLSGSTAEKPLRSGISQGLEVDPVTGNLLYLSLSHGEDTIVQELDTSTNPPVEVDRHMEDSPDGQQANGLGALHGAGGDRLYVSSNRDAIGHRLLVLTNEGAGPFELTIAPVDGIGPNEATFHGTINANGPTAFPASYRFEYSADGEEWIKVPADEGPFEDGEDHEVEDTVSGLDANTEYKVRLAGVRAFNGGIAQLTEEVDFTTTAVPPEVETRDSTLRTDTTATLVGLLHPQNAPTEWNFEWGQDEGYGNTTPVEVAESNKAIVVSATIEGLDPETTYHYRLIADNGVEEGPDDTTVVGGDATVTTRAVPPVSLGRAYEMVTQPFKGTRSLASFAGGPRSNANPGVPSFDGETIAWKTAFFPLTEEVDAILTGDMRYSERTADGWVDHTANSLGVNTETSFPNNLRFVNAASSGDLKTLAVTLAGGTDADADDQYNGTELDVPHEGDGYLRFYTRRDGTGVRGFTGWLDDTDAQYCLILGLESGCSDAALGAEDNALLNDEGTAMVRWGEYRGLAEDSGTPGDEDPSDEQQLLGLGTFGAGPGGLAVYLQRAGHPSDLPMAPKRLVNECTGTGSAATEVPNRPFAGPSTTIGARDCAKGNVVSVRGAQVGSPRGANQTALTDDGNRVFFVAPDPESTGVVESCTTDTGVETNCPPQLYVRQHGPNGEEFVRWISRSRSEPVGDGSYEGSSIPLQRMTQLDGGAFFQRASRDGRVVYFQAKAPLTPDDPNGGESITAGKASDDSWDLYRYELPADRSVDPDEGRLLRVTGGPEGLADPGASRTSSGGLSESIGTSTRFISEDGGRAYFVTDEPIAGADATAPTGGATAPEGSGRKLYLFDGSESGADRWRFVARIPFTTSSTSVDAPSNCATGQIQMGLQFTSLLIPPHTPRFTLAIGGNCFRGTRDGAFVVFHSNARLTTDDGDDATDLFLYDAAADELIRISAPRDPAASPYACHSKSGSGGSFEVLGTCNAHLNQFSGSGGHWVERMVGQGEGMRGWNGLAYMNVGENPDGTVSVYFNSRSRLVPEDTNADFTDVYEWRNGELSLLTRGKEEKDAWFSGNSTDGEDVFFITEERIDPREIDDDDLDIYDARVGGGFPYTPPPEPCDVLGFECESEANPAAPVRGAASLLTGPSGNVSPPKGKARRRSCGGAKLRRGKRCVRKVALARKRCRKLRGRAKRRCVRKQVRRLTRAQKRQQRRAAKRKQRRSR